MLTIGMLVAHGHKNTYYGYAYIAMGYIMDISMPYIASITKLRYQIEEEIDDLSNQSRIQNCNTRAVLHFSWSTNAYLAETCLSNTNLAFTCLANTYIHTFVFDKHVSTKYANLQKDNLLLKLWTWMIRDPLRLQIAM